MKPWTQRSRIIILTALTIFMVTQYQNCAPVPPGADSAAGADMNAASINGQSSPSGTANIIDFNYGQTDLSIPQSQIVASTSQAQISVQGVCPASQTGAVLHWQLLDTQQDVIKDGYVNCESSQFVVSIDLDNTIACGVPYELSVHLGVGQPGTTVVVRSCN